MKGVLYIGHGTRSQKGATEAKTFLENLITKVPIEIQEISFLELTEPSIEVGFRECVKRGATEITIVPIFLLAAGHTKRDIPEIISKLQEEYPTIKITIKNALGVQEDILDAMVELVRTTVVDFTSQDSILIVGRGSSDPDIHQAFTEIERGIKERLKVEKIASCYLAAAKPTFQEGLDMMLMKASHRVIVIPYLLFSGLLLSEVILWCKKQGPKVIQIDPLSRHQAIEKVIVKNALGGFKDAAVND